MIRAGVLLAAGASRRFGPQDKLLAQLQGTPLVTHAATALAASDFDVLIGVVRSAHVAQHLPGFDIVQPPEPDPKQSDSLRAGITRARDLGAGRVTVLLADMPFVTAALVDDVTHACTDARPAAATDGNRPMPPVCFPAVYLDALMRLKGDRGAASLVTDAVLVPATTGMLVDIDTPETLMAMARSPNDA
ncbi:MAG: nucleotidyltransferase family protein [Pseudomonadota bacterium]